MRAARVSLLALDSPSRLLTSSNSLLAPTDCRGIMHSLWRRVIPLGIASRHLRLRLSTAKGDPPMSVPILPGESCPRLDLHSGCRGGVLTPRAWAAETVPVGVAKIDITLDGPAHVRLRGAQDGVRRNRRAARAAAGHYADAGDGPAVLLTVDCGSVPAAMRDEVLPRPGQGRSSPERFMLCNSHNHWDPT